MDAYSIAYVSDLRIGSEVEVISYCQYLYNKAKKYLDSISCSNQTTLFPKMVDYFDA